MLISNKKGLSLLEVMIASTIMAFIAIAVVTITDSSVKTKETILSEDEEILQVQMMFSRFQNDFELIYSPLFFSAKEDKKVDIKKSAFNHYDGNERYEFPTKLGHPVPKYDYKEGEYFTFFIFNNKRRMQDSKQSKFAWVRYAILDDYNKKNDDKPIESKSNKSVKILRRCKVAEDIYAKESFDWEKIKCHNVLENIESLKFLFWDEKKKEYTDIFANIPNGRNILKKIKLKLTWVDKNGNEIEEERIFRSIWPDFEDDTPKEGDPNTNSEPNVNRIDELED